MFVAYQKKQENICEYFLYMFQVEDIIRACEVKKEMVEKILLPKYPSDITTQNEVKQWYNGLIDQMKEEKTEQKGHLISLNNKINEVLDFHLYLMNNLKEVAYQACFEKVLPLLQELRTKQSTEIVSDLHLALNAVYGFILIRMKGSQVSKSTAEAMAVFVEWFNMLSAKFKDYEEGNLKIDI